MAKNFNNKVLVAMSGGVDSSVAAALLKEQGYDLIGITMGLACSSKAADRGCCSFSAAADAKKIADQLGFPHYTVNFKDEFKHLVIDDFIDEYKNGRTPNPCIRCNQFLKFDLLIKKARELGAEFIATGHYARIKRWVPPETESLGSSHLLIELEGNREFHSRGFPSVFKLLKGVDPKKDQSYVLYTLTQEVLAHTLFPLGELTKDKVREKAKKLGLSVAEKAESQEICFVEDDDYGRFIREALPEAVKPGDIVDKNGKTVGRHNGIAFYTIGQRKGVGAHQGNPRYVIAIDRERNQVVIGDSEDLMAKELTAEHVSFISGEIPTTPLEVEAKIRYNSREAEAEVRWLDDGMVGVKFRQPQRAVTPGQSVVFYREDEVLGGGIIKS